MSNKDYAEYIWELYKREMNSRNNDDYEADPTQMQKLIDAYGFFMEIAGTCNGKVELSKLVPREINGGITAYFTVFYLNGESVRQFCKILQGFSALSIDSLEDGTVCLSFTVPRVFRHK